MNLRNIYDKNEFWQSKYDYYKKIVCWVVIAASISSIMYFFSDCYLNGGFFTATLWPRMVILIPMTIYLILYNKTNNYKIMVPMAYILAHGVMWCTIWACVYLPDLGFTTEGFIIINFIFLAMGIGCPIHMSIVAHGLLLVDITIANTLLHIYPEFAMMLFLGVPSYLGTCLFNVAIERTFVDQYLLNKKLEQNLVHDNVTGAYNRNIMSSLSDDAKNLLVAPSAPVSFVMIDVDFFKNINDTYGHEKGDATLVEISKLILGMIGTNDKLIRWGGDEFVILMNTDKEKACKLAEKMRQGVEKLDLPAPNVTLSMGVAGYVGGNYELTLNAADKALYKAKSNGRNRVEMA